MTTDDGARSVNGDVTRMDRPPDRYKPAVFLSYPSPYEPGQREFVECLRAELDRRCFTPRTLGITDYNMSAPLRAVRSVLLDSHGMIVVAFRRVNIIRGNAIVRHGTAQPRRLNLSGQWFTSPWVHIEAAMAYQEGLPVLILSEAGVFVEGMLDASAVGIYMPVFSLAEDLTSYFHSNEFTALFSDWEHHVRTVIGKKSADPRLY